MRSQNSLSCMSRQKPAIEFPTLEHRNGILSGLINVLNLHEHLLKVLEQGMAEGVFRPMKPFIALTHILSVCLFYFTVHENWKHLTPEVDRLSPEQIEEHTEEAIAFILAAVKR